MKKILTIAGSDSGGGAGIQADLKTIAVLGGYGMSAITALTAQNTLGVTGIEPVAPGFVAEQLEAVLSDMGCHAAKTGMLFSREIIRVVAGKVREYGVPNLVVDPVMVAASGDPLLKKDAEEALVSELFPLATIVTPNIPEAERITGREIKDVEDMKHAAREIARTGPAAVLVKGGHLGAAAVDVLFDGRDFHPFEAERIATENTHGTGCAFSAALAFWLAWGLPLKDAVSQAKEFITAAIRRGLKVGRGRGPADPYGAAMLDFERLRVLAALKEAFDLLAADPLGHLLVPEVQMNICYALPGAMDPSEVAGFPGRIVRLKDRVASVAEPEFGASGHVARIVITAMARHPELRAAMNIRYSQETIAAAERLGIPAASFSRADEPEDIKAKEGSTLSWGVAGALDSMEGRPALVCDKGDVGKEAMIRVLGESPGEVVALALKLIHSATRG